MQQTDAVLGLIESLRDRTPGLAFGMYSGYSGRKLASSGYWCCGSELTQREGSRVACQIAPEPGMERDCAMAQGLNL